MLSLLRFLPFVLLVSMACGILPTGWNNPEQASLRPTRTSMPTFTPTSQVQPTLAIPPTATPPPPPPPTDTPVPSPPTDTPTPAPPPTDTPPPPPPPAEPPPAPPPTQPPPPPAEPAAPAAQNGVTGKISFRDGRNTYAVGEKVFVKIEAVNIEGGAKPFGILGLTTSAGNFQTSWDNSSLEMGKPFTHEDGLAFAAPGSYKMWLSICFSTKEECQGPNGNWVRFEPGVDVTIQ